MKTDNLTKIAGLSLAALLALTACGDGDNGGNGDADDANGGDEQAEGEEGKAGGETFAFEDSAAGPYDEVTVTVPDEYDDAVALNVETGETEDDGTGEQRAVTEEYTYAESEVIESITLRPAEPEEAQCAIEAEYQFNHDTIGDEPVNQVAQSFDDPDIHDVDSMIQWFELEEDQVIAYDDDYAIWEFEQTGLYSNLIGGSEVDPSPENDFAETHTLTEEVDCNSPVTLAFTTVPGIQEDTDVIEGETMTHVGLTSVNDSAEIFATFDVAIDAETGELSIQNANIDADD